MKIETIQTGWTLVSSSVPDRGSHIEGKIIDCIMMTHLDCDPVSGIHDFEDRKVICSKEEYKYAKEKRIRYG